MGICLSARIKAETPSHTEVGVNDTTKNGASSNDGTDLSPNSSSSGKPSSSSLTFSSDGEILNFPNLKNFTFSELKSATKNFRSDNLIGEGGFGSVYKGWIDQQSLTATKPGTGMIVAVKRLNPESFQGHREWLAEVNFLGLLSHPNLVKLIGYCLEDQHRLLVYEFMPKGSLENHLFRRGIYYQPLSWQLRLEVALDAAKGLAFLHSSDVKVIYRDLKSSNVLLDSQYNAKLSDFGLAKEGPTGDKSHVSTRVMGTHGYAAPEYLATGHLTSKSDVYSFGVVLLELLSGRRAVDKNRPSGQHNLVDWARPYLINRRKLLHILDNRIQGQFKLEAADRVAAMAFRCLSVETKFRPSMGEVVREIERVMGGGKGVGGRCGDGEKNRGGERGGAAGSTPGRAGGVSYPRPSDSLLYA